MTHFSLLVLYSSKLYSSFRVTKSISHLHILLWEMRISTWILSLLTAGRIEIEITRSSQLSILHVITLYWYHKKKDLVEIVLLKFRRHFSKFKFPHLLTNKHLLTLLLFANKEAIGYEYKHE